MSNSLIVLGTDEAGYGPNLGPLLVSVCAWEIDGGDDFELERRLLENGIFSPEPAESKPGHLPIIVADSKKLHTVKSLAGLRRTVLCMLKHLGRKANSYKELTAAISSPESAPEFVPPWESGYDFPLGFPESETKTAAEFSAAISGQKIAFLDLASRVVHPLEFNRILGECNSKGTLLSRTTISLVVRVLEKLANNPNGLCGGGSVKILCDKHGGRNRYADVLYEFFPDEWIEVLEEGRELSAYRFNWRSHTLEFEFRAKGESRIPTALASLCSKYLRELAMIPFNRFWKDQIPGLAPTAGYPEDAKRFIAEIRDYRECLNIADEVLWRNK